MKRLAVVFAAATLLAGGAYYLVSSKPPAPELPPEVLAQVGDRIITRQAFVDEMALRGGQRAGYFQTPTQRRALLDAMIEHERMLQAALEAGVDERPEVKRAVQRILVDRYRDELLETRYEQLTISDDELERYYTKNADKYSRPERRRAALIQVSVAANATDEARKKARQRIEQAAAAAQALGPEVQHFGNVARQFSDDRATRYTGGVIGWLTPGRSSRYKWDQAVIETLFSMQEPGQISPVIETQDGLYIARLVELEAGGARPLEDVAEGIRIALLREKREQVKEALFSDQGLGAYINEGLLAEIEPLAGAAADPREPPAMPRSSR
ncbi:MAG: peptidyl-prolyl cis-trans isomerase [Pseudomonadota bacterium]